MPSGLEWIATPAFARAVIHAAAPLYLGVLAALLCQRAGLVNLGIEGMMLAGACAGAAVALGLGPAAGTATGTMAGTALALLHALATIRFRVGQLVSGLAVNVLAFGVAGLLSGAAFGPGGRSSGLGHLPVVAVPWLGPLSPLAPLALLLGLAILVELRLGVTGLRLDACAEAPQAAVRAGLELERLRYGALLASGALAGLAGAGLSTEFVGHYQPGITQGRGFLALAVCLLVNRSVLAGAAAAVLLGGLQALPAFLPAGQAAGLLVAAPWLVALVALTVLAGRVRLPRAVAETWRAGASP